jgi:hypothetical protein
MTWNPRTHHSPTFPLHLATPSLHVPAVISRCSGSDRGTPAKPRCVLPHARLPEPHAHAQLSLLSREVDPPPSGFVRPRPHVAFWLSSSPLRPRSSGVGPPFSLPDPTTDALGSIPSTHP